MFRNLRQPKILLKNSLAALLTITLSGAFYLFCCQVMKAAEKSEHCPLNSPVRTEHCNFSKKTTETPLAAASIRLFECCQLKFNFFVAKLEKNELPQAASARAPGIFKSPEFRKPADKTGSVDFYYRANVFESRDLHVRNCVFRI